MSDTRTTMDQSFIQKMQYMSLNGQTDSSRYGRIMPTSKSNETSPYHQQKPQETTNDYTICDRTNVIASSKYATPKQVETIQSQTGKIVEENDVYVQCAKPQVPVSPTHSLSSSSQHSDSPRASIAANSSAVYENIDYYSPGGTSHGYYQYRKAQPQVPVGGRRSTDTENYPVYENVQKTGAVPGPQVPVYSVMQPKLAQQSFYHYNKSPSKMLTQQQLDEINNSDYVCMTGNVSHTLSTNTPFQTTTARNYDRSPATGIAQTPTKVAAPTKEAKKPAPMPDVIEKSPPPQPAPSPTPSQCSTSSGKLKISGKTLLPYSVTPPKPRGPTEAEKKIEEMTRQIEEEMEKHEEEGEYFGKM